MLNFHIIFLKRFFYFKMQKNLYIYFFCIFLFNIIFLKNIILALLFSILFIFNNFFFFFFFKYYCNLLRKSILGLKLTSYKNFNNGEIFLNNGNPDQYFFKGRDVNLNVKQMLQFLENEIYKVFILMNFSKKHQNENKIYENFLKKIIIKKILFLSSYLSQWQLYSLLGLFSSKNTKISDDIIKKNKRKKYFIFSYFSSIKDYLYMTLSRSGVEFIKSTKEYNNLRKGGKRKRTRRKSLYLRYFLEYFTKILIHNRRSMVNNFINPSTSTRNMKFRKFVNRMKFLNILKSLNLQNIILRKFINFFSNSKIRIIQFSIKNMQEMLFFFDFLNKKNFNFSFFYFNFNIYFTIKKNILTYFLKETKIHDLFLVFLFSIKQDDCYYGVCFLKYNTLVQKEKSIFELEMDMNNFDIYTEKLLTELILKFSNNEKQKLIKEYTKYYYLENSFKNFLECYNFNTDVIDKKKFFNDNLNEILLFFLKRDKQKIKYIYKNFFYREKYKSFKITSYNIINFSSNIYKVKNKELYAKSSFDNFNIKYYSNFFYKYYKAGFIKKTYKNLHIRYSDKIFDMFYKQSFKN
jgi:hypothetical protein